MSDEVKFVLFSVVPVIEDVLLVLLFLRGIFVCRKRKTDSCARLVSLSPILLWVGAVGGGVLSIPITLFGPDVSSGGAWYLLEVGILVCIAMILAYCNDTIIYDDTSFEAGNLLGIKRTYGYEEITGISHKGGDTVLHCGRRKIRLDSMASGDDEFLAYADKAHFRQCKKYIPVHTSRRDPMNGNLDTPWFYFILDLGMIAASIFLMTCILPVLKPADDSIPSDAFEVRTSFSSYEQIRQDSGTLLLYAPGYEKPFAVSWLSGYEISVPAPEALCSGDSFHVTVAEARDQYYIYAISGDDKSPILSAYDYNTAYRNTQLIPCIGLLIFGVLASASGIFGILVGRHPERYPAWFRGLFYKKSAWTYQTGFHRNTHRNTHSKRRRRK